MKDHWHDSTKHEQYILLICIITADSQLFLAFLLLLLTLCHRNLYPLLPGNKRDTLFKLNTVCKMVPILFQYFLGNMP